MQDILEQKRSLQRKLSVPEHVSDSNVSAYACSSTLSEVPDSSKAPGQHPVGASAGQNITQ